MAEGIIVAKFEEKKKTLSKDVQRGGFVLCSNTSQDKIKELSFSHPRKILNITVTIFPRLSEARSCQELASINCPKTINSRLKITGKKIEKILANVVVACILCHMDLIVVFIITTSIITTSSITTSSSTTCPARVVFVLYQYCKTENRHDIVWGPDSVQHV